MKNKKFTFLTILPLNAIIIFSGLLRYKKIAEYGDAHLVGLLATSFALISISSSLIMGNYWATMFVSKRSKKSKRENSYFLIQPLVKNLYRYFLVSIFLSVSAFILGMHVSPLFIVLVYFALIAQTAASLSTAYLRSINEESRLSFYIAINYVLTTLSFSCHHSVNIEYFVLANSFFNLMQWILTCRFAKNDLLLTLVNVPNKTFKKTEDLSRKSTLSPVSNLIFDLVWRIIMGVIGKGSLIGFLQPSILFLTTAEPTLQNILLSLKNRKFNVVITSRKSNRQVILYGLYFTLVPYSILFIFALFANQLIVIFFGISFTQYQNAFQLILCSSIFRFLTSYLNFLHLRNGTPKVLSNIAFGSLIIRLMLLIFLVPKFEVNGVAYSLVAESICTLLFSSYILFYEKRNSKLRYKFSNEQDRS